MCYYCGLLRTITFARWFDGLNAIAAARVTIALTWLSLGNFSKGAGAGVYFGKDGEQIVILLGGSANSGKAP